MAKAIASRTGQKLDINQQCLSEGLANLTGSFFQCMPGSGSLTRSAVNQQAGAMTQWSGVFAAGGGGDCGAVCPTGPLCAARRPGRHPHGDGLAHGGQGTVCGTT